MLLRRSEAPGQQKGQRMHSPSFLIIPSRRAGKDLDKIRLLQGLLFHDGVLRSNNT